MANSDEKKRPEYEDKDIGAGYSIRTWPDGHVEMLLYGKSLGGRSFKDSRRREKRS